MSYKHTLLKSIPSSFHLGTSPMLRILRHLPFVFLCFSSSLHPCSSSSSFSSRLSFYIPSISPPQPLTIFFYFPSLVPLFLSVRFWEPGSLPSPPFMAASCRSHCFQIQPPMFQHRFRCLCSCSWQGLDQLESDRRCQEVAILLAQKPFLLSFKYPRMHDPGNHEPVVSFHSSCFFPLQCWYRMHLARLIIPPTPWYQAFCFLAEARVRVKRPKEWTVYL